ncbi:MAG: hypothetical protein K2X42_06875 [Burkholderiaceae bacterium]|nr:hypothetical protein [Burkholderiaceae bacterium]
MTPHLDALRLRLSHERGRLGAARSAAERLQRQTWVAQIEREIAGELEFLGMPPESTAPIDDEQLLFELTGGCPATSPHPKI